MKFSDRVKYVRMKRQLSQNELADQLKIARSTLCRWERGEAEPRLVGMGKFMEYCERHDIHFDDEKQ